MSDLLGEHLVNVIEAAAMLGVRPRWVYEHLDQLPGFSVGRYLRFRPSELKSWLETQRIGAPPTQSEPPAPEVAS